MNNAPPDAASRTRRPRAQVRTPAPFPDTHGAAPHRGIFRPTAPFAPCTVGSYDGAPRDGSTWTHGGTVAAPCFAAVPFSAVPVSSVPEIALGTPPTSRTSPTVFALRGRSIDSLGGRVGLLAVNRIPLIGPIVPHQGSSPPPPASLLRTTAESDQLGLSHTNGPFRWRPLLRSALTPAYTISWCVS